MAGTLPDTTRQHPADRLLLSRLAAVDDVPASDRISFHSVRPAALAADFSYAAHVPPAGRPAGRLGGYREVGSTQSSSEHFHEVFMSLRIQLGSITIQRVVEQEAPFFDALQF